MIAYQTRRPLEDMIGDLVEGLVVPGGLRSGGGLHATSAEFTLPVETHIARGPGGLVVHADMPATRTPSSLDMPVGRLVMRLTTFATGVAP